MGKVKTVLAGLITIALCSGAQAAVTSEKQAQAAVKYRQSLYQLVKSNSSPLFGMAKGAVPFDTEVMATNAMRLEQLADMMADYMLVDTTKFDVDTDAKPAIFDDLDAAKGKIAQFKKAAMGLTAALETGDKGNYVKAIGALGGSCKSCHDDYKE